MDFGLTAEQESIIAAVRGALAREWPEWLLKAAESSAHPLPRSVWRSMAAEGLTGLVVPQRYGGAGHGFTELALALEETGRWLLPGPFLSTAVCALAIQDSGTEAQRASLLPAIAAGELAMAPAAGEPGGGRGVDGARLQAAPSEGGYTLNGVESLVPAGADRLIVAAAPADGDSAGGVSLFLVDARQPGVSETRLPVMGVDRFAEVEFRDAWVTADSLLGAAGGGAPLLERLSAWQGVGRCAELVGVAQAALDMTVEYVKGRFAFGRPVGSFQAVQHHCANMLADVESARHLTRQAAWLLANGRYDAPEASMAMAWTGEAARRVTATAHQCHGAIGFTTDLTLHLYHKRALAGELLLGSAERHLERVAAAALNPSSSLMGED